MSDKNFRIEGILSLIKFTNQFRLIKRGTLMNDGRKENDLEHSYQLAMLVWYLNDVYKLKFDTSKLLKYSLAHDLVEVYAGDFDTYQTGIGDSEKTVKEIEAFKRITEEFSEFNSLLKAIENYEKKSDKESKFVYSIDKIMSSLNSVANENKEYKKAGVTKKDFINRNAEKVSVSEEGKIIFDDLLLYIEKIDPEFFMEK